MKRATKSHLALNGDGTEINTTHKTMCYEMRNVRVLYATQMVFIVMFRLLYLSCSYQQPPCFSNALYI